tara:strand:- start:189 stop:344 length:156 start_codon:yes stop_codon:yes gene_type:complete
MDLKLNTTLKIRQKNKIMKKLLLILLCLPMIGFGQCISGDCENGYGTFDAY